MTFDDLPWRPCVADGPVTAGMPSGGTIFVRHLNGSASLVAVDRLAREGWAFVVEINGPVQDWMVVAGVYEASEVGLDDNPADWHDVSLDTPPSVLVH